MALLGDLALIVGAIGIIIYLYLIITRYTNRAGKLSAARKRYDEQILQLQQKIEELQAARDEKAPQVDELVDRMVTLRGWRDKLQMGYEEMVEKSRTRDIHIKTNLH